MRNLRQSLQVFRAVAPARQPFTDCTNLPSQAEAASIIAAAAQHRLGPNILSTKLARHNELFGFVQHAEHTAAASPAAQQRIGLPSTSESHYPLSGSLLDFQSDAGQEPGCFASPGLPDCLTPLESALTTPNTSGARLLRGNSIAAPGQHAQAPGSSASRSGVGQLHPNSLASLFSRTSPGISEASPPSASSSLVFSQFPDDASALAAALQSPAMDLAWSQVLLRDSPAVLERTRPMRKQTANAAKPPRAGTAKAMPEPVNSGQSPQAVNSELAAVIAHAIERQTVLCPADGRAAPQW